MARRIESHLLDGPAGKLEAILEEPEDAPIREACLVCHPHPLGGGTMRNKVVHRIARGIRLSGAVVLRFNFRGVGRSEGEHAGGTGELEDAREALVWLRGRYPDLPYSLAGFSFGSRIILKLGSELGDAVRMIAAGFPTKHADVSFLRSCAIPKIFIQSTHDQFAPVAEIKSLFAEMSEPKRLEFIEAEDHFFALALDQFEAAVKAAAAN